MKPFQGVAKRGGSLLLRAVFLSLLIPGISIVISAEETVLHRFAAEEPDRDLENVLYYAAATELARAGLSSRRTPGNSQYTLLTEYERHDDDVTVSYVLRDSRSRGRALSRSEIHVAIDHDLGTGVASAIRTLLRSAEVDVEPSLDATIEGLLPGRPALQAPETDARGEPESRPDKRPDARPQARPENRPGRDEREADPKRREGEGPRSTAGLSLMSATGPAMLFGGIARYVHYGATASIAAARTWAGPQRRFHVGAQITGLRGFNDRDVAGGPLYLTTAGPTLGLGTGADTPFRVEGEISAGVAFVTVAGSGDPVTRATSYAGATFRPSVPLGAHLHFGLAMRYFLILDEEFLIPFAISAFTLEVEL